jgi:hypothetical protein
VNDGDQRVGDRAERRAAPGLIGRYHEEQLGLLLEHVREGFARLDAGEIDAFDLDELIHRYKRSARALEILRAKRFGLAVRGPDAPIRRSTGRGSAGLVGCRRVAASPLTKLSAALDLRSVGELA